jgi:hypothetical protein
LEKIKWFKFLVKIAERCILKNGLGIAVINVIIEFVNLAFPNIKVNMEAVSNVVNVHLDK